MKDSATHSNATGQLDATPAPGTSSSALGVSRELKFALSKGTSALQCSAPTTANVRLPVV